MFSAPIGCLPDQAGLPWANIFRATRQAIADRAIRTTAPTQAMHVERFTEPEQIEPYRSAWNALAGEIPFRRYEWLMSWWRHFGGDNQLAILAVLDDDRLVGLAPWYETSQSGGRTLRFLGDGEVCTDYLDVLAASGSEAAVAEQLAHWLQQALAEGRLPWSLLEWENLEATTPVARYLADELSDQEALVHRAEAVNCWRLEMPTTWLEFEMRQSKSHRKQIRRLISRVLDTPRAKLHVCHSQACLDQALPILIDLHMRRRNSLDQPGCFASPRFDGFLREAAGKLMADGHCEILWLELDHQPIAAEIHFLGGPIVYAYQAGIDPDRLGEDPGSLMQIAVLRRAVEQGKQAVDFLRGDEPYKAHWRAEPRSCETIRVVPNTTAARIRHGLWVTQTQMKNWVKAGLALRGG